jgi:MFS transporter, putative metabolite:H+ symporter
LLPAGNLLGALGGSYLSPIIGWRGLFLVGLLPTVLVLMIRYWVPESPRCAHAHGTTGGSAQIAGVGAPNRTGQIVLPTAVACGGRTQWWELFKYPRSMAAACLTGLSQTGGVGLLLWITTLFVLVLKITPAEAAYLMIYVTSIGILGRTFSSYLSDAMGRRRSGMLIGFFAALFMALAGYFHDASIGTWIGCVAWAAAAFFGPETKGRVLVPDLVVA